MLRLAGARHSRVVDITSSKNVFFGAVVIQSSHSVIRDGSVQPTTSRLRETGSGCSAPNTSRSRGNSIKDNRGGPGIHVDASNGNLIKGNLLSHSSPGVL